MAALDPFIGVLGKRNAAHLLRRTTFGYTRKMVDNFAGLTIESALDILFTPVPMPDDSTLTWLIKDSTMDFSEEKQIEYFRCWMLQNMRKAGASIFEKMVFFLHTHFTTIQSVVGSHASLYYQHKMFRYYAFGNIRTLVKKYCIDNATLKFLNGDSNDKNNPNENFAREFLELFTIGKGTSAGDGDYTNYTESDIQAVSRVLSGYGIDKTYSNLDPDTGIPRGIIITSAATQSSTAPATRHDAGVKILSPRFDALQIVPSTVLPDNNATIGAAEGELDTLADKIFSKKETAKNIIRKLYRFFIYYKITPQIELSVIEPLSVILIQNNYELQPVVRLLLKSQHIFDADNTIVTDDSRGAIIKSPLELALGILIYFNASENPLPPPGDKENYFSPYQYLHTSLKEQGLDYYEPLDVAGYDAYSQGPYFNRNWISANYLAYRYKFPQYLFNALQENNYYSFYIDVLKFIEEPGQVSDPSNATLLVQELIDYLLPEPVTNERYTYFKSIFLDQFGDLQWQMEWTKYKSTGNQVVVRKQLEILFWTLLKSPEYQLN